MRSTDRSHLQAPHLASGHLMRDLPNKVQDGAWARLGAEQAIVARPSSGTVGGGVDSRPLPLTQYLDEREEEARVAPTAHIF